MNRTFVPPPSRGRLGGGWFSALLSVRSMAAKNHPHPNPPLEGDGIAAVGADIGVSA